MNPNDYYRGTPVCLADRITVAAGGNGIFNSARLSANESQPMLIDEIGFTLEVPGSGTEYAEAGAGALGIEILCGQWKLTNGFVPISLLSPRPFYSSTNYTGIRRGMTYRWKFAHSLYVPKHYGFAVRLKRRGATKNGYAAECWQGATYGSGSVPVTTAIRGRYIEERDAVDFAYVPYAAHWEGDLAKARTYTAENDMRNMTNQPVRVNRLIGYIEQVDTSTPNVKVSGSYNANVRISKSFEQDVPMAISAAFSNVFDPVRFTYDCPLVLAPSESINASFETSVSQSGRSDYPYAGAMIGFIGWRKEKV